MNRSIKHRKISEAFEIEKIRDRYARNGEYKKLRMTYSKKFPEITDKNSADFWNSLYRVGKKNVGAMYLAKERFILKKIMPYSKVLSVGIGSGQLEKKLLNKSIELSGIDISSYAIKKLKKKTDGTFRIANAYHIPFNTNIFDYILLLEIIEHVVPVKTFKVLAEAKRVLKPEGQLIVSVPLNEGLENLIKTGINPSGHVRVYTKRLLETELKMSGFEIIHSKTLYAFKTHYLLKDILSRTVLRRRWMANNLIIVANNCAENKNCRGSS